MTAAASMIAAQSNLVTRRVSQSPGRNLNIVKTLSSLHQDSHSSTIADLWLFSQRRNNSKICASIYIECYMRSLRILISLLVIGASFATPDSARNSPGLVTAQNPPIGIIDFYGLRSVSEQRARQALQIKEGDSVPESRKEAQHRLEALPDVQQALLNPTCCESGRSILYVGSYVNALYRRSSKCPVGKVPDTRFNPSCSWGASAIFPKTKFRETGTAENAKL